ncbi:MAG: TadE/TadG family type IV pilus assembly protein [Rhizobiaceae bacterium]
MRAWKVDKRAAACGQAEKASLPARFLRDRRGTTAIEFVILAIPFSLLVFAILESCVAFAAQQVLANTADKVARELRTGQYTPATLSPGQIQTMICTPIQIMVPTGCPNLVIDLEQYQTFADAAKVRIKFKADGSLDTSGFKIDPGGTGTKNMLRVFYEWPIITPFMKGLLANLPDGKTLLFASVTWQNEPY